MWGPCEPWQAFSILFWESFKSLKYNVADVLTVILRRKHNKHQGLKTGSQQRRKNGEKKASGNCTKELRL